MIKFLINFFNNRCYYKLINFKELKKLRKKR